LVSPCSIGLNKRGSLIPQYLIRLECPLGLQMLCKLTGSLITQNQLRHRLQLIQKAKSSFGEFDLLQTSLVGYSTMNVIPQHTRGCKQPKLRKGWCKSDGTFPLEVRHETYYTKYSKL